MIERLTLVAVDDDHERYRYLSERLDLHAVDVWCSDVPSAVLQRIKRRDVIGVFLDHDMPRWLGPQFVPHLPEGMPVCVSSANRAGAKAIASKLTEYRRPHVVMSAIDPSPEERWLGWALDLVWRHRIKMDAAEATK
jgi:hypothetical protein